MDKFNINDFINLQKSNNNIDLKDFPEIDLYMDQVMQLFENKLNNSKRYDYDKVLTKTMINNYAKSNLLMKIKNKKYTKNHLILMSLIYTLKGSLSLTDIKTILTPIINAFEKEEDYPLEEIYQHFLDISNQNIDDFKISSDSIYDKVSIVVNSKSLGNYEKNLLLICSYINMSNFYRRISEKLIDECFDTSKDSN